MYFRSTLLPLLLLLFIPFQSTDDAFRQHYLKAEAYTRAGNLAAAESEYNAILALAYHKLGRIETAQAEYQKAVAALESAAAYRPDEPAVLVDLAVAYFHAGQYEKAVAPLNKALARDPTSEAAHQMLGKTYFMTGEFERAGQELEEALKLNPKDYDVEYTLGLTYLKRHQFAPARQLYERMSVQLGNRPQLRVLIGRAYRETGFLPEALEEFQKAIALDPKFPRVHYHLAITYLLKDGATRLNDAMAELKTEMAAHPDEYFAIYYLGMLYISDGKWEQAIAYLQKAAEVQPNNPDPYFFLGQAYQGLEKYGPAIEAFRKAIALNPTLSHNNYQVTNAHYRLAQSLMKSGHSEEGQQELQLSAELKNKAFKREEAKIDTFVNVADLSEQKEFPELSTAQGVIAEQDAPDARAAGALKTDALYYTKVIATAHSDIGLLRAGRQDFRGAASQFAQAAKWDPQHEGLDYNLGLAYYKSESYREAVTPLENELRAHPSNLAVKQLLGLSYFMTEVYPKASTLLTEVIAAKPDETALYYPLSLSLAREGKMEASKGVIERMVLKGGDSPQFHILLGRVYYEQNEIARALEELRAALTLDRRTLLAHFYTGLIYLKSGKLDEAAREFEAELSLNSGDVQAMYHLGYVSIARGETERGIKLLREVIGLKPEFGDARFELGKALLQQGDLKGALESLELAAKLEPDQAHVHYQLGRAYLAAGRQAEGESQLEISKQLKDKARNQTGQPNQTNH
ncbi:MAG TPA: tetratricopeptide repeat protein [Pyrinomonadaceae bacterium]|jgi:tetratricopeptide (TPR) repeat protein|nr:tetratricopeptide repeat protein [Pyrinomonadaceae bacterium]